MNSAAQIKDWLVAPRIAVLPSHCAAIASGADAGVTRTAINTIHHHLSVQCVYKFKASGWKNTAIVVFRGHGLGFCTF